MAYWDIYKEYGCSYMKVTGTVNIVLFYTIVDRNFEYRPAKIITIISF